MTTRWWQCERAWLGGPTFAANVTIRATDGVIDEVTEGASPGSATHLTGVVLPGFANAHSHAFHRALRGRQRGGARTFWGWRDQMYELASRLDPDSLRELATASFAEMLCAGFTAVGEFHYLHHDRDGRPFADVNEMGRAVLDAAATAGVRLTLLDTCYLESSPGEPPRGVQHRFADASVSAWAERVEGLSPGAGGAVVGAAVHSLRAVPPDAAEVVARWAAHRDAPLHAHVSEQPAENDLTRNAYGATPTALLFAAGALTGAFTAVHATHVIGSDRALLLDAGATVCVCPTTERDLGDGLVELAPLVAAGIPISVGTDSHAVVDPFDELRCLEGHERLRTHERGTCAAAQLLEAATGTAHRSLGRPFGGRIAPGAPCDLVEISTGSARLAGTVDDVAGLLAAASAADVRTVIVAGEPLVVDGSHRTLDVADRLGRAIEAVWA